MLTLLNHFNLPWHNFFIKRLSYGHTTGKTVKKKKKLFLKLLSLVSYYISHNFLLKKYQWLPLLTVSKRLTRGLFQPQFVSGKVVASLPQLYLWQNLAKGYFPTSVIAKCSAKCLPITWVCLELEIPSPSDPQSIC